MFGLFRPKKRLWHSLACWFTLVNWFSCSLSFSQSLTERENGGSIIVHRSVPVHVEPSRLRVGFSIQSQGRDTAEAIKVLATHKAKIREAMKEWNADLSTLEFSASHLIHGTPGLEDRSNYRVQRGDDPFGFDEVNQEQDDPDLPKVYTASAYASIEWAVPTKDLDALLTMPDAIRKQIAKRGLNGKINSVEFTEEEKSAILAELRRLGLSGAEFATEAEIAFEFVGVLSDDAYRDSIKRAFDVAKKEGRILAEATGHSLGKMLSIQANIQNETHPVSATYQSYPTLRSTTDREIGSVSPERMKANVHVDVTFSIDK